MASADESDRSQMLLEIEEEGANEDARQKGTRDSENDPITEDDDILITKIPTNQPTNIQGWADSAYAVLRDCLDNLGGGLL